MTLRNLRQTICTTVVVTALLSLLVFGQGTTSQPQSKSKATSKRKPTTRKTTLPLQPAQPVQPQAAQPEAAQSPAAQPQATQSQPTQPPSVQPQPTPPQPTQSQPPSQPQSPQTAPMQQSAVPSQPLQPPAPPPQPTQPQSPTQSQSLQAAPEQQPAVPFLPPQSLSPQPPSPAQQPALQPTSVNVTPAPATPNGAGASASPKKTGVLRIGVLLPITQISPDAGLALSEAIRQLLISYLNGPIAEAIPLEARVPVQFEVEAKQKECDFIFYSAVGREQRSSSFAKIMKNATPIVGLIPGTGAATTAAGAATTAATTTATTTDKVLKAATDLSGNIKAKDEISVEFKLTAQGNATPKLSHILKAKAKTDGDQVLSSLLAEAANVVLQAAIQK